MTMILDGTNGVTFSDVSTQSTGLIADEVKALIG